jgi:hypothetical protein
VVAFAVAASGCHGERVDRSVFLTLFAMTETTPASAGVGAHWRSFDVVLPLFAQGV